MAKATITLNKRPCKLGNSAGMNTEKHGEENVGALDLSLDGIMLSASELDTLLGHGSHKRLYQIPDPSSEQTFIEVAMPALVMPLKSKWKFEDARIDLWLGVNNDEIKLHACDVDGIVLTLNPGGLTTMKCHVRAHPEEQDVGMLYRHMNEDTAHVGIYNAKEADEKKAKKKQTELPLEEGDEHPDPDATIGDEAEQAKEPETAEA
jgi:hypothetical protein